MSPPVIALALMTAVNPYLPQAKVFFQGGDYKQCLKRVEQARKWESTPAEQVDAALYSGLCKFQLRRTAEAEADFAVALKLDPTVQLPPLTSPKVLQLFESMRPKSDASPVAPEPDHEPAPEPVRDAPLTRQIDSAPANASLEQEPEAHSTVPIFPIVLGGAAVLALGTSIYFGSNAGSLDSQSHQATFYSDAVSLRQQASTSALIANVGYVFAGAAAIAALVLFFVLR